MDLILRQGVDRALTFDRDIAATLCNDMLVDFLAAKGFVRDERLVQAMRAHRRDTFLPDADLRAVYSDRAVNLLDDPEGWMQTSGSAPSIVISMIEALDVPDQPGARILEIGTGSGYSTAILAASAPQSTIITVELIDSVRDAAHARLAAQGFDNVTTLAHGDDPFADGPVDRIVATCAFDEIPTSWCDNLVDGGLIVVPVGAYVYKFQRRGDGLVGAPWMTAAFVPRRDAAAAPLDADPSVADGVRGRFVLWGDGTWAEALRDGHAPFATRRAVIPPAVLTAGRLRLDHAALGRRFEFSGPHDWGFGLVTSDGEAACIVRVPGELGFRHYVDSPDQVTVELHGAPDDAGRLADGVESLLIPEVGSRGDTFVEVSRVDGASAEQVGAVVRGGHRWVCRQELPATS